MLSIVCLFVSIVVYCFMLVVYVVPFRLWRRVLTGLERTPAAHASAPRRLNLALLLFARDLLRYVFCSMRFDFPWLDFPLISRMLFDWRDQTCTSKGTWWQGSVETWEILTTELRRYYHYQVPIMIIIITISIIFTIACSESSHWKPAVHRSGGKHGALSSYALAYVAPTCTSSTFGEEKQTAENVYIYIERER